MQFERLFKAVPTTSASSTRSIPSTSVLVANQFQSSIKAVSKTGQATIQKKTTIKASERTESTDQAYFLQSGRSLDHATLSKLGMRILQCNSLKFNGEMKGMRCAAGKIKLPQLREPLMSLKSLLAGYTAESEHFLSIIRKYNSCFQMTSEIADGFHEADEAFNYPTEFLNSLDLPRISLQVLQLKIGVTIIMLQDTNQPKLCNSMLLAMKKN
ncbi:unnamed protein product [Onchocerca ochengi]|uniref:ATP-dependent DNA helicase n=1 Tax=Onchocerca ochengi TaxID=42157 RepID=A0A182ECC6_ONCOC|nr:unnamed protein product [Onchocerca ochengi]